jgi:hypothetical protein
VDAERGSPQYKKAAMRWLERYLTESSPRLKRFADIACLYRGRCARSNRPRTCWTYRGGDFMILKPSLRLDLPNPTSP